MHKRPVVGLMAVLAAAGLTLTPLTASASSHREAPLIAQDPLADNTDVYAFQAPDDFSRTVLVADWVPFQPAANGPNFSKFGDDVLYQVHVDNVGDAKSHITFSFRFHSCIVDPSTFLYSSNAPNPITSNGTSSCNAPDGTAVSVPYANWNQPQSYDLTVSSDNSGDNMQGTSATNLPSPPDVVGGRDTPNYHNLAKKAVNNIGDGIKVFAGLRDDPFFINVGGIFDLLNINGQRTGGVDNLAGLNVRTIAISIPSTKLEGPNKDHIIGVWATSSRNATTVRTDAKTLGPIAQGAATPQFRTPSNSQNANVQVSRLGMPLVNEVVVDLGRKDLFNATTPAQDAQFLSRVTDPLLAKLINVVFPGAAAPEHDRTDLVAVFLTGIKGLNMPANANQVPGDELRLNMDIAPSHTNPNDVNRLGALGGEKDGFPNGRRLGDDVTDIALQAVDGATCAFGTPVCTPGALATTIGDGVAKDADATLMTEFPYVADPHSP